MKVVFEPDFTPVDYPKMDLIKPRNSRGTDQFLGLSLSWVDQVVSGVPRAPGGQAPEHRGAARQRELGGAAQGEALRASEGEKLVGWASGWGKLRLFERDCWDRWDSCPVGGIHSLLGLVERKNKKSPSILRSLIVCEKIRVRQ